MIKASHCYIAVFVLLALAGIFLFRADRLLLAHFARSANKHQKEKLFRKQGRLSKGFAKATERGMDIIAESEVPIAGYIMLTVLCGIAGFFAGRVIYNSLVISLTVGVVGLIAPLLFFSFRQTKNHAIQLHRLASSMMILSNSYIVTEDFVTTVRDNLEILEYPAPFREFLTYVTLMDNNITHGLRRMEAQVNNPYFSQWVDALVMAQEDRALKYVAVSVVESMHDVLQAQAESDAAMYAVWRDYFVVLILIFSVPLIFKIMLADVYVTLTTSFFGQLLFVLLLVAVLYSVLRALRINRPMMV